MSANLYYYKAKVKRVIDGDTIVVDLDLGLNIWAHDVVLRLIRINTPELNKEEKEQGLLAKNFLNDLIKDKEIVVKTIKVDSWRRWLSEVWLEENLNLSDHLISLGIAKKFSNQKPPKS